MGAGFSRTHRLRESEIQNLDRLVRRDLDVGRFQVAVDDAVLVRGLQSFGDLQRNAQRLLEAHRTTREPLGERLALDEFHDEQMASARLLHPEQDGNARMIQRGEGPGFTLESRDPIRIRGHLVGQDLDGDAASQLGITGAIHRAHSTFTEQALNREGAKGGADHLGAHDTISGSQGCVITRISYASSALTMISLPSAATS